MGSSFESFVREFLAREQRRASTEVERTRMWVEGETNGLLPGLNTDITEASGACCRGGDEVLWGAAGSGPFGNSATSGPRMLTWWPTWRTSAPLVTDFEGCSCTPSTGRRCRPQRTRVVGHDVYVLELNLAVAGDSIARSTISWRCSRQRRAARQVSLYRRCGVADAEDFSFDSALVAGVDGCRSGWVVVLRDRIAGTHLARVGAANFHAVLALPEAPAVIAVDAAHLLLATASSCACEALARPAPPHAGVERVLRAHRAALAAFRAGRIRAVSTANRGGVATPRSLHPPED